MSKFEHECYEWDGLRVAETDIEFACCSCDFGSPELNAEAATHRDARSKDLDAYNERTLNKDLI